MHGLNRTPEPSPVGVAPRTRDTLAHLVAQRNSLVDRLNNGSRQIEAMRASGENLESLERFWIRLLHQYERVCDRIAELEGARELRQAS